MKENILGISCYYHDSAAVLISDGEIISAVQEERFSRKKHDSRFPKNAIKYCLNSNNLNLRDISMGMSNDYMEAINQGSTFIRVGSKIFGARG